MGNFNFSDYDYTDETPYVETPKAQETPKKKFDFSEYDYETPGPANAEPEEGFVKSGIRTALQVPQGRLELTPPGIAAGLWHLFAHGESELDPYEEANLFNQSKAQGKEFSKQEYEANRQEALSTLPTVTNIARGIEKKIALPLEPKTPLQKGVRFATQVSSGIPNPSTAAPKGYAIRGTNTGLPKPVLGAAAAGTREAMIQAGVPEPIADLASLSIIKPTTSSSGQVSIGPVKKESGLTKRKFESIEKPTEISKRSLEKIHEKTEREFRDITDKIIKDTPIKETFASLRDNPQFKQNAREAFQEVQNIAENIPDKVHTNDLINQIDNVVKSKTYKDFLISEYEKNYLKSIKELKKDTSSGEATASGLVRVFRKNNKSYGEIKEPGQSFAYNQAKRDALRDYNIGIEKTIESKYPNSNFHEAFKETNERWSKIMDAESISEFLDETFAGKIDFKNAKELFDKNGMNAPFERAMGKQGFSQFKTLVNDLMGAEKGYKLLRKAKEMGYGDIAQTVGAYAIHPEAAAYKGGFDILKGGYKTMFDMLMDKPEIAITWDRGINAFKAGNFKVAEKELSQVRSLEETLQKSEQKRIETLKKFNEKKSQPHVQ